jgi:carbohydrate kinase (thermoresistant glucokinase family)
VKPPNKVVLMGVSGAGKTTIGLLLASKLDGLFIDGDNLHSQANVKKMKKGVPLTDNDRRYWLGRVAKVISNHDDTRPLIIACSALKQSYRQRLGEDYHLIYLKGTSRQIAQRLQKRKSQDSKKHFMPVSLLNSQLDSLEEPYKAIVMDLNQSPHEITKKIILALS